MTLVDLAQIVGALGFIPGLLWIGRRLMRDPKGQAETRKLNIEADEIIVDRLYAEIERLDRRFGDVETELAAVKVTAADEKTSLERENRALRTEVGRLKARVHELEQILKVGTTPEDMRRQLAEIDRKTKRSVS